MLCVVDLIFSMWRGPPLVLIGGMSLTDQLHLMFCSTSSKYIFLLKEIILLSILF